MVRDSAQKSSEMHCIFLPIMQLLRNICDITMNRRYWPMRVDSLIPVSFLAGINAGGRSLFIIHYHDLMHQFSVYFNLITVKI